ncbi:MAG: 1,4-alpha-glucan branching enzyme, partial [Gammaproteobacteria bacterium]|nr:1,4-alpha-glucan branching enzyme [Gammaproteobacteria bacterium]
MTDRPVLTMPGETLMPSDADVDALVRAEHGNPFSILGPHPDGGGIVIRAYLPNALGAEVLDRDEQLLAVMEQGQVPGFFFIRLPHQQPYLLKIRWAGGEQITEDPYSFGPQLGELDMHLFSEGNHRQIGRVFGSQVLEVDGVQGVRFAVWAPNARRVSIVGSFNGWDGRRHPMRLRFPSGV